MKKFKINEHSFEAQDASILDTVIASDFALPHNCKDGRCKNCVVICKDSGKLFLACQTIPKAGQSFVCEGLSEFQLPPSKSIPSKILTVEETGKFIEVTLKYSDKISINYLKGQYLNLQIGNATRSYSICALDDERKLIKLLISPVANGVATQFFMGNPVGQIIRIELPFGTFVYREPEIIDALSVYVCTGSGIVPVLNTFDQENGIPENVRVYWGIRYNCSKVQEIVKRYPSNLITFVSQEQTASNLEPGRVSFSKIQELERVVAWYLVGNPDMIEEFSSKIEKLNKNNKIYKDPFC